MSVIPCISIAFAADIGGPAELIWAWVVGSFFIIIAGASMAEIASVYPTAGSVYHWAGVLCPEPWSRFVAYNCGWFNLIGNAAGNATSSACMFV